MRDGIVFCDGAISEVVYALVHRYGVSHVQVAQIVSVVTPVPKA